MSEVQSGWIECREKVLGALVFESLHYTKPFLHPCDVLNLGISPFYVTQTLLYTDMKCAHMMLVGDIPKTRPSICCYVNMLGIIIYSCFAPDVFFESEEFVMKEQLQNLIIFMYPAITDFYVVEGLAETTKPVSQLSV